MTTYTSEEFATHTLKALGLLGAEETPSDADLEWAIQVTASEVLMLAAIGIPVWNGSEVDIPQEYLGILARRCGLALAPSFGLVDMAQAQLAMREAERYLTILAAPRIGSPLPLSADDAARTMGRRFNYTLGQ